MSFQFRLQRLLELRAKAEQGRARTLVDAAERADELRRQQSAVQTLRQLQRESAEAAATGRITAGELQQFTYLLDQLDHRLARTADDVQQAERLVDEARMALQDASRDRRVLDRLKDRHEQRFHEAAVQQDRLLMDEVALSRFTQARRAGGTPDGGMPDGGAVPHGDGTTDTSHHSSSPATPVSSGDPS